MREGTSGVPPEEVGGTLRKKLRNVKDTTRRGKGRASDFKSDLKWSLIGRKRFLSLRIDVILNKIELSKNIQSVTMV